MIDIAFTLAYIALIGFTRSAIVPTLAFLLTVVVGLAEFDMVIQHTLYILAYIVCILFAAPKIAYAMLASTVVNFLSVAYFLSPMHLKGYTDYFVISMVVVNLCILLTIYRSGKSGEHVSNDDLVFTRLSNLLNVQAHTKTSQRR